MGAMFLLSFQLTVQVYLVPENLLHGTMGWLT